MAGNVKSVLDVAPEYLNFVIGSVKHPTKFLRPYRRKEKVNSDLTSLLLAGLALAYVVLFVAPAAELEDMGNLTKIVRYLNDKDVLPLSVLVFISVFSMLLHVSVKLVDMLMRPNSERILNGTVEDTINASFAFASMYIPFATTILIVMALLFGDAKTSPNTWRIIALVVFGVLNAGVFFVCFSLCLYGVHDCNKKLDAFYALGIGIVVIALIFQIMFKLVA